MNQDERGADDAPTPEEQLPSLKGAVRRQSLFTLVGVVVAPLLLAVSLWGLREAFEATADVKVVNPALRLQDTANAVPATRDSLGAELEPFFSLVADSRPDIVQQHFGELYSAARAWEHAWREFLFHYQQSVFNVAGRVGGSGVWHDFYSDRLDQFRRNSRYQQMQSGLGGIETEVSEP